MKISTRYVNGDVNRLQRMVAKGVSSIVSDVDPAIGVPHAVWLVVGDGAPLSITCEMVEVEERFEVGRLVIAFDEQLPVSGVRIDLPIEWQATFAMSLLQVKEHPPWVRSGGAAVDVEAGVKINASVDKVWMILVGAQPCTLALDAPFVATVSHPQYSGDRYVVMPM